MAAVDSRVPVVVGASDLTTANTIRRAKYAQQAGADAAMILPISYWKLTEREIVQHYTAVAAAIDIPIMVYNNPATSGIDISPEVLVQMFNDIDNVQMVKESTGDLSRMRRIKALSGGALPFYNGSNPLVLDALREGASGWCTAAPNLRPQRCLDLYDAVRADDIDRAQSIYDNLAPCSVSSWPAGCPPRSKPDSTSSAAMWVSPGLPCFHWTPPGVMSSRPSWRRYHNERPLRLAHARKGPGAYGTFTVTGDIPACTNAALFSEAGKQTETFVRFSTAAGDRGVEAMTPIGFLDTVSVGRARQMSVRGRVIDSAIAKSATAEAVWVGRLGLTGDEHGDRVHHGGPDKAVLAYPSEHYTAWADQLGRPERPPSART